MMRVLLLIFTISVMASCSLPHTGNDYGVEQEFVDKTKIFNIVIKKWGRQDYSGLLAVKNKPDSLHYILLDPTGIKLLDSEVGKNNDDLEKSEKTMMGPLAGSSLNDFLNTVMKRVYIEKPDEFPCSWNGLLHFCFSVTSDAEWKKVRRVWPLPYWRAEKQINDNLQTVFLYHQPWLGVDIELKEINRLQ